MSGDPALPFLDTNILVYSITGGAKKPRADALLDSPFQLSVQALNEFSSVAARKLKLPEDRVIGSAARFAALAKLVHPVTIEIHKHALTLTYRYHFQFYDALMVACALQAGSPVLYSEDMQHRLLVDDQLTIINPFLS
jgi:predicted nucleic acid-binding protein